MFRGAGVPKSAFPSRSLGNEQNHFAEFLSQVMFQILRRIASHSVTVLM